MSGALILRYRGSFKGILKAITRFRGSFKGILKVHEVTCMSVREGGGEKRANDACRTRASLVQPPATILTFD